MLDRTPAATRDRIAGVVAKLLEERGKDTRILPERGLVDAGLTSMDMVNLMLGIEAEFDVTIPPADITPANFKSIGTIEALMRRVTAEAA